MASTDKKPRFERGDNVKHVESGRGYTIIHAPAWFLRLEHCDEPFYQYRSYGQDTDAVIWCRAQSEMEDGRFVKGI